MNHIKYDMQEIDECISRLDKLLQLSEEGLLALDEGSSFFSTPYASQICDVQSSMLETYHIDLSIIKTNIAELNENLKYARMKINENEQR